MFESWGVFSDMLSTEHSRWDRGQIWVDKLSLSFEFGGQEVTVMRHTDGPFSRSFIAIKDVTPI